MSNGNKKPTIMRTNRIIVKNMTIYCSSMIMGDQPLKELLMRSGQKMFPMRGNSDAVLDRLRALCRKFPDHFPNSSRTLITQGDLSFSQQSLLNQIEGN